MTNRERWMIQGRERLRFTLEPRQTFWLEGEGVRQDLDLRLAAKRRIRRLDSRFWRRFEGRDFIRQTE